MPEQSKLTFIYIQAEGEDAVQTALTSLAEIIEHSMPVGDAPPINIDVLPAPQPPKKKGAKS